MALRTFQATDVGYPHGFLRFFAVQGNEFIVVSIVLALHFRLAMAVNTPAHREWRNVFNHFHILDFTVTGLAGHLAHVHVLCVVEVSKVGQVVYPHPFYGLVLLNGRVDLLNFQLSRVDHPVAVHTNVKGRNTGRFALGYRCVAVVAVNLVLAGVQFM